MNRKKTALCVVVGIILGLTIAPVNAQWTMGDFWSLLDNTVVLTNQSTNVHIGSNATTNSQLRITGNTTFNGSVNFVAGTTTFSKTATFNDDAVIAHHLWLNEPLTSGLGGTLELNADCQLNDPAAWENDGHFVNYHVVNNQGTSVTNYSASARLNYDHAATQTWVTDTKNWQCAPVPKGGIILWSGTTIPQGWHICNGTGGTPDLRGRFIIGSNSTLALNATGGASTVTITNATMPAHYHTYNAFGTGTLITIGSGTRGQVTANTGTTGSGQPHENMPPYYVLAYIMFTG